LAVPGTAGQFGFYSNAAPGMAAPMAASTAGLFSDPSVAKLSITLPTRFEALDVGAHPLQTFGG
jgi:hypothetical protein